MKAVLMIDTTSNEIIKVGLSISGEDYVIEQRLDKNRAQVVLPLIDKILTEKKIKLENITAIKVNAGPGSYTGIRVGLTVANTLGFMLGVPINGLPVGQTAEPIYS